jgi:hypothetical protein
MNYNSKKIRGKILKETDKGILFLVKANVRWKDRPNSLWFPKDVVTNVKLRGTEDEVKKYGSRSATLYVKDSYISILKHQFKI